MAETESPLVVSAVLQSIQVGLPRQHGDEGATNPLDRPWTSGFFKHPVAGPVHLGRTNLAGDGQADTVHHGGPDKAVLAYAASHYNAWRQELSQPELPWGAFGENFTIAGQTEANVCLGDVWQIGEWVTVQVSQPRQPCWKLARRWRIKTLPALVQNSGRTGWYLRVLTEGFVEAGMTMTLQERLHPLWTVARANQVMHIDKHDREAAAALAALPCLAGSWKATLEQRVAGLSDSDPAGRLLGPNA